MSDPNAPDTASAELREANAALLRRREEHADAKAADAVAEHAAGKAELLQSVDRAREAAASPARGAQAVETLPAPTVSPDDAGKATITGKLDRLAAAAERTGTPAPGKRRHPRRGSPAAPTGQKPAHGQLVATPRGLKLADARNAAEVLAAEAGPVGDTPTPEALAAWLPECPEPARAEAADLVVRIAHVLMAADPPRTPPSPAEREAGSVTIETRDLDTGEVTHRRTFDTTRPRIASWSRLRGPFGSGPMPVAMDAAAMATFARRWLLTDPAEAGWLTPSEHPDLDDPEWDGDGDPPVVTLTPRAERLHALWSAAREHDPDLRHPLAPLVAAWQQRVTPRPARKLVNRASLPRLARLGPDDARLPDFPGDDAPPAPDGQLLLPGFGEAVRGCASWLLWLFDQAGEGGKPGGGRGARWDLRLFVYAMLHLDVADRDGQWHTIRRSTDEVIGWLHPNGWANARRDWRKLPAALHLMRDLAYVPVPGIGSVAMLFPSVVPERRDDPLVEWTIRIPPAAARGDRLNWPRLLAYGADSDRVFRAYLAAAAWLGRSAKRGHPITREIAAPLLGPDGKPRRRKGGAIIRSSTERMPNPATRYIGPPLSEADLTRMIGFDPSDRRRRHDARVAFERMEADGAIEIERDGTSWRLFAGPNW